MSHAFDLIVTGDLYKSGFRFYAQEKGIEMGITGTISYYGEAGDVFIHAEGDEIILQQYIDWCARGLPYCKVYKVDVKVVPLLNYHSFDIVAANPVFADYAEVEVPPRRKTLRLRIFGF